MAWAGVMQNDAAPNFRAISFVTSNNHLIDSFSCLERYTELNSRHIFFSQVTTISLTRSATE
jgi:hypothetical protein